MKGEGEQIEAKFPTRFPGPQYYPKRQPTEPASQHECKIWIGNSKLLWRFCFKTKTNWKVIHSMEYLQHAFLKNNDRYPSKTAGQS